VTAPGALALHIGNQSAFTAPLLVPFEFALKHGFGAFEWFPDRKPDGSGWAPADLTAGQRQELRARARDAGMRLSVHAPIEADPLRPGSGRDVEESLRLAIDLGAGLLNIHFSDPRRTEELAGALVPLIPRCAISGVKLAIENVPATSPEDFNRLFALLPRIGSNSGATVGMCLDIGHANLHEATRNNYIGFVDRLRAEVPIIHLHLHENHGDRDSHLVLFTGPAGRDPTGPVLLLDRLRQRGYEGNAVLEQWPSPPELLVQARDRLVSLLPGGRK
jgi:sugar phosphate isomerase/epimerase